MRIAETSPSVISDLWSRVEPGIRRAPSLEQASQVLVETLYEVFHESVVLARVFCTVPFDALPPSNRRVAQRVVETTGSPEDLRTVTPVLSLVGTFGIEPEWCDRRNSRGHLGIPLISEAFVQRIPMIARLLKELGIPLEQIESSDSVAIEKTMARSAGLFYVADARSATDTHGRRIIPAQDFVSANGIRSVFGVAGAYIGGQVVVLIVFCRDPLPRTAAEQFLALAALFKSKTAILVGRGRIFGPPAEARATKSARTLQQSSRPHGRQGGK